MAILDTASMIVKAAWDVLSVVLEKGWQILSALWEYVLWLWNFLAQNFRYDNPAAILVLSFAYTLLWIVLIVSLLVSGTVVLGLSASQKSSVGADFSDLYSGSSSVAPSSVTTTSYSSSTTVPVLRGLCGNGRCDRSRYVPVLQDLASPLCPGVSRSYVNVPSACLASGSDSYLISSGASGSNPVCLVDLSKVLNVFCSYSVSSPYVYIDFSEDGTNCALDCGNDDFCTRDNRDSGQMPSGWSYNQQILLTDVFPDQVNRSVEDALNSGFSYRCVGCGEGGDPRNVGKCMFFETQYAEQSSVCNTYDGRSVAQYANMKLHCACASDNDCIGEFFEGNKNCCLSSGDLNFGFCYADKYCDVAF